MVTRVTEMSADRCKERIVMHAASPLHTDPLRDALARRTAGRTMLVAGCHGVHPQGDRVMVALERLERGR